jgi:hypothetical protein
MAALDAVMVKRAGPKSGDVKGMITARRTRSRTGALHYVSASIGPVEYHASIFDIKMIKACLST